jgi:hypothetical protein
LEENQMAKPVSISLHKFTSSVQAAVKAAAEKHPKFRQVPVPSGISFGNLIWGIPVPDGVLAQVTVGELQSYVTDVAAHIGQAGREQLGAAFKAPEGVFGSFGHVVHCGIPPLTELATLTA